MSWIIILPQQTEGGITPMCPKLRHEWVITSHRNYGILLLIPNLGLIMLLLRGTWWIYCLPDTVKSYSLLHIDISMPERVNHWYVQLFWGTEKVLHVHVFVISYHWGGPCSSNTTLWKTETCSSYIMNARDLWPLLLTWLNFNPSMDK